jgi:hypothetical protein
LGEFFVFGDLVIFGLGLIERWGAREERDGRGAREERGKRGGSEKKTK